MREFSILLASLCGLVAVGSATITSAMPVAANPSFEDDNYTVWPGYTSDNGGAITGWPDLAGRTGINNITTSINPFLNGQTPPDGNQAAFIQNGGGYIRQAVSGFIPGQSYRLLYYETERGTGGPASPYAKVGGQAIVSEHRIQGASGFKEVLSYPFVATASTLSLELGNGTRYSSGDNTVLYDAVSFSPVKGSAIPDGGFESPVQPGPGSWELFKQANGTGNGTLAGSAWVWTGGAGISHDGSAFEGGNQSALEGVQHALIQNLGTFSQTLNLLPGWEYELTWLDAARNSQNGGNAYQVLVDGVPVFGGAGGFTPTDFGYLRRWSDAFLADSSTALLTFSGLTPLGPGTDMTTFFDAVEAIPVREVIPIPEPATLSLLGLAALARLPFRRRGLRRR